MKTVRMRLMIFCGLFSFLLCLSSLQMVRAEGEEDGAAAEPQPEGEPAAEPAAEPVAADGAPEPEAKDDTVDNKDFPKDQAAAEPEGEPAADEDLKQSQKAQPQGGNGGEGKNGAGALLSQTIPIIVTLAVAKFVF